MSAMARSLYGRFAAVATLMVMGMTALPPAGATTVSVPYPYCDVNLIQASTSPDEPTQGLIAISLGGAPATAEDCAPDDGNTIFVGATTGDNAYATWVSAAVNGCTSVGPIPVLQFTEARVGGSVTHCGEAYLVNVSVFDDARGSGAVPDSPGYASFSIFGDASGSVIAVAPLGAAQSSGGFEVGCTTPSTGNALLRWQWCSTAQALAPESIQLIYSILQGLSANGLAGSQAALNYYYGVMGGDSYELMTGSLSSPTIAVQYDAVSPIPVSSTSACEMNLRGEFVGTREVATGNISGFWQYEANSVCDSEGPANQYMSVEAQLRHNGQDVSDAPTRFCFDCRVISTDPQMVFCDRCNGSWEASSGHFIEAPVGYRFVEKHDEGCTTGPQGEDIFCLITATKFFT